MSEREHRECFDELTLLQTRGSELCLVIVSPPRARRMSEGMRLATLHHNEMVRELAAFRAMVSTTVESVLRRSPNNVARAEVVGELVAELHRVEGHHSKLQRPTDKICDLQLRPPPGRAWLADHLEEVVGRLRVELDARWEAEAKLDALQSSMVWFRGLVLGDADRSSTQVMSMSMVAKLLEGQIDTAAANGVRWGSRSTLVFVVSHYSGPVVTQD
jgi:hypothetical protein